MSDPWDPEQYARFAAERREPFDDLVALIEPVPGGRVVDLGCGSGELTAELHQRLQAAETVGIDSSKAMLDKAAAHAGGGLRFEQGDIATFAGDGEWDVMFANASIQWVPDHRSLLPRLAAAVRPGGQLGIQVPANYDHPSHVVARALGADYGLPTGERHGGVLEPVAYAELLYDLGLTDRHVRLQVYGHELDSTEDVVEWTKGTLLTPYRRELAEEDYARFLTDYRQRLVAALGEHHPYLFPFKRILMYARQPGFATGGGGGA